MSIQSGKNERRQRLRRFIAVCACLTLFLVIPALPTTNNLISLQEQPIASSAINHGLVSDRYTLAIEALASLPVKDSISSSSYDRSYFADEWGDIGGCDTRNRILARDLKTVILAEDSCTVLSGVLEQSYFSGKKTPFIKGKTSDDIHIDHLVPISDAWRKGAQLLSKATRNQFYNDPLNLLAVDSDSNIQKGNKDASLWLPKTDYRCRYIARQIAVKQKYNLWISNTEKQVMEQTLSTCPTQVLPSISDKAL